MTDYDAAIVGGGPAGLSAANVLGRCRRRVVVIDDGKPRNYAAKEVHGYLGLEHVSPWELRSAGRRQAEHYGAIFLDDEVTAVCTCGDKFSQFRLDLATGATLRVNKLLLATGVKDELPQLENLREFYGLSVHHCPYCDGWEHRDQPIAALGDGASALGLALALRTWTDQVTACTNGVELSEHDLARARRHGIPVRPERAVRLAGADGQVERLHFAAGPPLECRALFFNGEMVQRSSLPRMLGCQCDERGMILTRGKQGAGVPGLFLAGDADGDVQFAIVAAAEGAIAATAINRELQDESHGEAEAIKQPAGPPHASGNAAG